MSMTLQALGLAAMAAVLAAALAPLSRELGFATGAVDRPGGRRVHDGLVPRLGGMAICGGLVGTLGLAIAMGWLDQAVFATSRVDWRLVALGALLVVSIGVIDDTRSMGAGPKLLVQATAAGMVVAAGALVQEVTNPFSGTSYPLGMMTGPITMLWVIGITNALNLIDGLDGLAAGVGLIVATTLGLLSLGAGRFDVASIALVLAGAQAGFLFFNFNPASIFLGDSGSLLLGFLLAVLGIESAHKGTTAVFVLTPILALGVPIMETVLTVTRRFVASFARARLEGRRGLFGVALGSVMRPDGDHIHHRLLALGLNHRRAVVTLYGVCLSLNVVAVLSVKASGTDLALIALMIAAAMFLGVRHLGYSVRASAVLGAHRPHAQLALADGSSLAFSYVLAAALTEPEAGWGVLLPLALATSGAEIALMIAAGAYRHDARSAARVGWSLLGTLLFGVGTGSSLLWLVGGVGPAHASTLLLHFALAAVLASGLRVGAAIRRRVISAREQPPRRDVRLSVADVPGASEAPVGQHGSRAA